MIKRYNEIQKDNQFKELKNKKQLKIEKTKRNKSPRVMSSGKKQCYNSL